MIRALSYVNFNNDRTDACTDMVITCVDFRFRKHIVDLLGYEGCKEFDLISLRGASKAIIDAGSRAAVLESVETCRKLHGTQRLFLVDHIDCGAYGGSAAFSSPQEEESVHTERLREAAAILAESCPGIEIVPMYIDWYKLKPVGLEAEPVPAPAPAVSAEPIVVEVAPEQPVLVVEDV